MVYLSLFFIEVPLTLTEFLGLYAAAPLATLVYVLNVHDYRLCARQLLSSFPYYRYSVCTERSAGLLSCVPEITT